MSLKEDAIKEIQDWLNYYQDRINQIRKDEPSAVELCEILESLNVSKAGFSYGSIIITLPSVEESRNLLGEILQKTSIEQFIKVSKSTSTKLEWGYYVDYKGVGLTIFPAEPNKDCIEVKKTNVYTSWVCEQIGGENKMSLSVSKENIPT